MIRAINKLKQNKYLIIAVKLLLSFAVLGLAVQTLFADGIKPYCSYKDYNYQNDFAIEQITSLAIENQISQSFVAKGNILDNIFVYFGDISGENIDISISDEGGKTIAEMVINTSDYAANSWNSLGMEGDFFERDKTYTISFSSEIGLDSLYLDQGYAPVIFGECFNKNGSYDETLALGFQFTYRYMTLGSTFELFFKAASALLISLSLCYAIWNIEKLIEAYRNEKKNGGILYALYFSVSLVLIYNPVDSAKIEVSDFNRVIGAGLMVNVDASKRITNFNHWFIFFAFSFSLLYLLSNYWIQKKKTKEAKKIEKFLNELMVLANCSLVIRCITYFNDKASGNEAYYFSSDIILLAVVAAIAYIVLQLDNRISADDYAKLFLIGASVSYPIAIFASLEWGSGRVLVGVMTIIAAIIMVVCRFGRRWISSEFFQSFTNAGITVLVLIPLVTSFYIELIHILNQYSVFVSHPAKCFKAVFGLVAGLFFLITFLFSKKKAQVKHWKGWAFPWFALGVSFLSIQIPISSKYYPDIFESANYSILISDFLNYGKIPIVEHYGGHMMTSVWEGILYGIINSDYAGAALSPYSACITPFLVLLFFYMVKNVWDENMALFAALLFPFMDFWSYFGLGMLVCLFAMSYVKKNSYSRAALLWFAFVWCAVYRLDLGFAYGMAVIISMIIYVVITQNRKALKELGLTFAGWGIIGAAAWGIICIIKGINPVTRLAEFLIINLSNRNWAYSNIGNTANTIFGWSYIIIPFLIAVCLLYTIFSKSMRIRIGNEKWMLLMIMGWSYFGNFSRGLVRHSIAEMSTTIVLWTGYIFLSMFLSSYKDEKKLFLPVFMAFMLCNTLFVQDGNYTAASIADMAVSRPGAIIESWESSRFDEEIYAENKLNQDRVLADGGLIAEDEKLSDVFMTYWEQLKFDREVVHRVELNEDLQKYVDKYDLLSILLDDEETFVDFTNKTLLYSLLGRENPVYVSQSPLQLSGEFAQIEFTKEISDVPIVLMPVDDGNYACSNSLDGITNAYRYYKAAEYLYQNYVPLYRYGSDYAVWCRFQNYDDYKNKLSDVANGMEYVECEYIDYGYDGPIANIDANGNISYVYISALHNHSINQLPRIWAEGDGKNANDNAVLTALTENSGIYTFDRDTVTAGESGNYIKISARYDGADTSGMYYNDDEQVDAAVILGNYENGQFDEKCRYGMLFKEGTHDYLIRCSTDYYWYLGEINAVQIQTEGVLKDIEMSILEGD